jgi:site-specific recombinase XerD
MNQSFYEKFKEYLITDKKHSNNTIGKYISTLKTFLRWAVDQGVNQYYDFNKFKVDNEKTDIVFLEENELSAIYNLDLSD